MTLRVLKGSDINIRVLCHRHRRNHLRESKSQALVLFMEHSDRRRHSELCEPLKKVRI
jgi:hypothetical protein